MPPSPYPVEPDDERRARHLFTLKELADSGLALARKAAAKAHAQLDAPDPVPDQPAPAPAPDHHRTFERYARLVRLLIGLEHRIAEGIAPVRRPYRPAGAGDGPNPTGPAADPRRPKLRQYIHHATRSSPDRAQLRRAIDVTLDDALDRDPARKLPPCVVLHEVCQVYGLPFDLRTLPDEFLEPVPTGPP